jgi:hypothetical protein
LGEQIGQDAPLGLVVFLGNWIVAMDFSTKLIDCRPCEPPPFRHIPLGAAQLGLELGVLGRELPEFGFDRPKLLKRSPVV